MAEKQSKNDDPSAILELKKNFINPNNVLPTFANEVTLNYTDKEFFLTLYHLEPPIVISEEDARKVQEKAEVDAIAVARIVLTPKFAEALLKVIQSSVKKYQDKVKE